MLFLGQIGKFLGSVSCWFRADCGHFLVVLDGIFLVAVEELALIEKYVLLFMVFMVMASLLLDGLFLVVVEELSLLVANLRQKGVPDHKGE